eukprot:m.258116 g.258116  ORF g.258116 m.258116 type:complete len:435 (-) comp36152_c0_seq1:227-1531(-)
MSRTSSRTSTTMSDDNEPLLGEADEIAETVSLTANQRGPRAQTDEEREEIMEELKYGAEAVLSLIKPVSVTMICVIATIRSVGYYTTHNTQMPYAPMHESDNQSSGERFGGAIINVLIILCLLIAMTFLLVCLYKYRCYRAIHGWLMFSSFLLLFFFWGYYVMEVLDSQNLSLDYYTLAMIVWNFGAGGLYAIHWKGPLIVQQVYLVIISSLMALVLIKNLPDWTTWCLLAVVAVYDLFAVLCPGGPLKMLVETAQEREEPLFPALIYSSAMVWIVSMADVGYKKIEGADDSDDSLVDDSRDIKTFESSTVANEAYDPIESPVRQNQPRAQGQPQPPPPEEEEETGGIKLGLGDFIFYSVLVGKAATSGDYGTIAACYVAIIIGLVVTLFILSITQKALPALPISIAFGLVFYFATSAVIAPFMNQLAVHQAFC